MKMIVYIKRDPYGHTRRTGKRVRSHHTLGSRSTIDKVLQVGSAYQTASPAFLICANARGVGTGASLPVAAIVQTRTH